MKWWEIDGETVETVSDFIIYVYTQPGDSKYGKRKNYHVNYDHKISRMEIFIVYTGEQNMKVGKEKLSMYRVTMIRVQLFHQNPCKIKRMGKHYT